MASFVAGSVTQDGGVGLFFEVSTFNDSTSSTNLTFTENENQTIWVNLTKNNIVWNGVLDLKGYGIQSGSQYILERQATNDSGAGFPASCGQSLYQNISLDKTGWLASITISYQYDKEEWFGMDAGWNLSKASSGETADSGGVTTFWGTENKFINKTLNIAQELEVGNYSLYLWMPCGVPTSVLTAAKNSSSDSYTGGESSAGGDLTFWLNFVDMIYPNNTYLEVGTPDGTYEFNETGNLTTTNTTSNFSPAVNTYLDSCTADVNGNCQLPLLFHSNTEGILQIWNLNITSQRKYSFTYENQTLNWADNTYTLVVLDNTSTANFNYNGTFYNPTSVVGSNNVTFTVELNPFDELPTNTDYNFTVPMYWNVTITGLEGSTSTYNQTVYNSYLDNCSDFSTVGLNITLLNESNDAEVTGTIGGFFTAWLEGHASTFDFNLTWGGSSNYGLCIYPPFANYIIDSQIEYTATGFETKTYYHNNFNLTNVSQALNLYLTDGTTQVTFLVKDYDDNPLNNVLIKVLKYDLATNSYTTTEILNTDSDGNAYGQIVLNTEWYKFILEYNDEVVLETEPTKIVSTSKIFRVDLGEVDYFEDYEDINGVSYTPITFNNVTNMFSFTFSNSGGSIINICLNVIRRGVNSDTNLGTSCDSTAAATIMQNITVATGTDTFIAKAYAVIDGEEYIFDTKTVTFDELFKDYGQDGIFVTFLIALTLVMVGIWNPIVAVVLFVVTMVAASLLGLFYFSWGVIVALVIFAGITIYRLNRG